MKRQDFQRAIKRAFDLIISLLALALLSPLLGLIALTVRLTMGSSALFRQVRPGLRGEPFTIYKFRTMTDAWDAQGNLLPNTRHHPDELEPSAVDFRGDACIIRPVKIPGGD